MQAGSPNRAGNASPGSGGHACPGWGLQTRLVTETVFQASSAADDTTELTGEPEGTTHLPGKEGFQMDFNAFAFSAESPWIFGQVSWGPDSRGR